MILDDKSTYATDGQTVMILLIFEIFLWLLNIVAMILATRGPKNKSMRYLSMVDGSYGLRTESAEKPNVKPRDYLNQNSDESNRDSRLL